MCLYLGVAWRWECPSGGMGGCPPRGWLYWGVPHVGGWVRGEERGASPRVWLYSENMSRSATANLRYFSGGKT